MKPELKDALLEVREPIKYSALAKELGIGVRVLRTAIEELTKDGYTFAKTKGEFFHTTNHPEGIIFDYSKLSHHLHFGIVSDTHLADIHEQLDSLEEMYDIFEREGIRVVFHAGDITTGFGVFRGQEFEVKKFGQDQQIDYTVAKYPVRKGITTAFITGNHDLRQYELGGIDPGNPISQRRKDLRYLGQSLATVKFVENKKMEILHPGGKVAYALSYKAQRDINNRSKDSIPDILVYGHYHTSFYMHYRDIEFIQAPCFKTAGLWERRDGMNPTIGGWIVDATISNQGNIQKFKPELFTF